MDTSISSRTISKRYEGITRVIVVGAGGHAAELDDYILYAKQKFISAYSDWELVGFLDDNENSYNGYPFSAPFLGTIAHHQVIADVYYLIGIANVEFRKRIVSALLEKGAKFISFIHPDTYISRSAIVGEGVVIGPNVSMGPNTRLGDYSMLNSRCSIGHDSSIGSFNFLSPNVCLSGFTTVGDENLFGINSATIPRLKVGSRNKIMAGMTLDKSIDDDEIIFYRFKEKVIAIKK